MATVSVVCWKGTSKDGEGKPALLSVIKCIVRMMEVVGVSGGRADIIEPEGSGASDAVDLYIHCRAGKRMSAGSS